MNTLLKSKWPLFLLLALAFAGCKKDDDGGGDGPSTSELAASFQYEVSVGNFLEVTFTNFSANETSYDWDFGDGMNSTEENPVHVYSAAGPYTVTLTVSDGTDTKTKSESFTLVDPNVQTTVLSGTGSKVWHLQREGIALGIGPGIGINDWWSFGGVTPLGDRPCILDDSWTFKADGTVDFNSGGTVFVDTEANGGWLGPNAPEECIDDANMTSAAGDDLSAFGTGGDYAYDYDAVAGTLTVNGLGFYIGLANKTAAGDNYIPLSVKTYEVFNLVEGTIADTLQVALSADGSEAWNFYLVSYHDPADLPAIPGASAATAGFTYTTDGLNVSFANTSSSASSYSWTFGDGGSSTDASPTHTYAAEGDYDVTLIAMGAGGDDTDMQTISLNSATYSPAVLSNAAGKVWKLDGANSYYVGEGPGGNGYWPGVDQATADVERACQFDDEYIFTDGGAMQYDTKGEVWAESYMAGANNCIADGDLPAPYNVFGSATHAFTASGDQITVNGDGAFLGFNKPFNGGELDNAGTTAPVSTITYDVIGYELSGNTEKITISINYGMANDYWSMRLISVN